MLGIRDKSSTRLSLMGLGLIIVKGEKSNWTSPEWLEDPSTQILLDGTSFLHPVRSYPLMGLRNCLGSLYEPVYFQDRFITSLNTLGAYRFTPSEVSEFMTEYSNLIFI